MFSKPLSWVEINKKALEHNVKVFKSLTRDNAIVCACVKANAYGHGLVECAKIIGDSPLRRQSPLSRGQSPWLGVNAVFEAEILRKAGIKNPIYIMGYVPLDQLKDAARLGCRMVVYNSETVERLGLAGGGAAKLGKRVPLHIKIETGNNRQGLLAEDAIMLAKKIIKTAGVSLEGAATHFANIEDTTNRDYVSFQFKNFMNAINRIESVCGVKIPYKHCTNSAATMLFPEMHLDMVRVGIGLYGMWPSKETHVSVVEKNEKSVNLLPVLSWKTRIAQVKEIPEGSYIGYGCTYKTTSKTLIAIIPVGYYDGYDRKLSNSAYVLICGKRAQIRGRICMNIIMADVSDIKGVALEDEVVLIGKQGNENISIEQVATWCNTINYEIPTRINERVPRIVV